MNLTERQVHLKYCRGLLQLEVYFSIFGKNIEIDKKTLLFYVFYEIIMHKNIKKIIVAIDWFSWTWKWTTAKWVADKLWFIYIDTGAMYRAFTLYCLQNNIHRDEIEKVKKNLNKVSISFLKNNKTDHFDVMLNNLNVENQIRTLEVSQATAKFANIQFLRKWMVEQQQKMWIDGWIVMDGRDIGSIVFPDADVKVFLDADVEVRAERRLKQLKGKGEKWKVKKTSKEVFLQEIIKNIEERDASDRKRTDVLFEKYWDEVTIIDTTNLTIDEQIDKVMTICLQK